MKEDKTVGHKRLAWDEYFAAQALLISNWSSGTFFVFKMLIVKKYNDL